MLARQSEALELHSQGLSHDEIAQRLGYAHRSSAWRLIKSALSERVLRDADAAFSAQLRRLETILPTWWDRAMQGDLEALNAVLKILGHIDKLYGFDREVPPKLNPERPRSVCRYRSYEEWLAAEGQHT